MKTKNVKVIINDSKKSSAWYSRRCVYVTRYAEVLALVMFALTIINVILFCKR
jgi:hypothetical protein